MIGVAQRGPRRLDGLTFGGNIIETGTDSYGLASTRARAEQQAVGSSTTPPSRRYRALAFETSAVNAAIARKRS
ncbi:hypothetical protein GCM10010341_87050 [Streptomyces noursei]|nr:hypothetical protein GCM10010341_87050 [Streptomyces noursei]